MLWRQLHKKCCKQYWTSHGGSTPQSSSCTVHPSWKTIKVRRTRHARHCWRSKNKLIRDVLQWTPSHRRAKAGQPARTYIQQLSADTGCKPEDLLVAMNNREGVVKESHGYPCWWRNVMMRIKVLKMAREY